MEKDTKRKAPLEVVTPESFPLSEKIISLKTKNPNTPSIHIVGCGGAGINRAKLFRNADNLRVGMIDTSQANVLGIGDIAFDVIEDSSNPQEGAGKIRLTKADAIQKSISRLNQLKTIDDITIIVHSFSGGSGSVIGPCVAKYLGLERKPFIVLGIVDASAKQWTQNAINTILTYQGIAEKEGLYIPVKLFHNKDRRGSVDNQIHTFISDVVDMFQNEDTSELDLSDKINFLRPYLTEDHIGVYEFDIYTQDRSIKIQEPVHSVLTISESADSYEFNIDSNMRFAGKSSSRWYVSIVGKQLNHDILKDLQTELDRFETIVDKGSAVLGIRKKKNSDSSGFVL